MITIMGATGNIGSKIAETLLAKGTRVRLIGRDRKKLEAFEKRGAELAVGDAANHDFLTRAFTGSESVFTMIPPNYQAKSFKAHAESVGESICDAITRSKVKHVVSLSSVGADNKSGTGPIKYLHQQEQRLNQLQGVNVLHLRAGYFMENLYSNVPLIKKDGILGSMISGEVPMPMIATKDIADHATLRLTAKDFSGRSNQYLLGPKDVTQTEAAKAVSAAIGRPLKYIEFDEASTRQALQQMGFSPDMVGLFVEMSQAFNARSVRWNRDAENTTKTPIEEFAKTFTSMV
jgi:uncharacterized protein YbjT (DUF2867 family)